MARIRSLKPEFFLDRKLARNTSRDARLFYAGMWTLADEHARLNGDVRVLRGHLMPYEDDVTDETITGWLSELENHGGVQRYDVDGDPYLFLPKLAKHQRLEAAKVESRLPAPPEPSETQTDPGTGAESSESGADEPAPRAESSETIVALHVAGGMEHVAGGMEQVEPCADKSALSPKPRGTRIPTDWRPDDDLRAWTVAEGLTVDRARVELEKFRDYWTAKSGQSATKHDWPATWRNWVRRVLDEAPTANGHRGKPTSTTDDRVRQALALMEGSA